MGSVAPAVSAASPCAPAALSSPALARRLVELSADCRALDVEFLLHLAEFDARRDFAGMGYPSLWAYCTEVLALRDGAAWRRIEAMKLLRRFPALEPPLRDGRLSLTTLCALGPALTDENVPALVCRAAGLSKNDTVRLVASLRPVVAPAEVAPTEAQVGLGLAATASAAPVPVPEVEPTERTTTATEKALPVAPPWASPAFVPDVPSSRPRAELRPAGGRSWSLRVTIEDDAREELLRLAALTAHSTRGDLAAVLRDAVRCALEKHGKRRGAVRPERARRAVVDAGQNPASDPAEARDRAAVRDPRAVPAAVKQAVWERDGGRCAWTSKDGKRCGSTWKLQLGHVRPVALGGLATVEDLRIECALHNEYEAVRVFGRAHMARFKPSLRAGAGAKRTRP